MPNTVARDIIINGILPFIIYRSSVSQFGEWQALILASVPAIAQ